MPNWAGGVLTAKGRALQAKVEAGQTLELTKMKLGSGTPEPEEIDNLTDLKQPQNIMGISSKTVENNVCEVTSVILTSNINTPFYAREWGLFANDPDEGEILYMYTTDPNPDFIPAKTAALQISATYALNIVVLNVDNIIVNIDPNGLVTTAILKNELKKYLPLSGGTLEGDVIANNHLLVSNVYNKSKTLSLYTTPKETDNTIGIYDHNSDMNQNVFWYRNSDKFFRFEVPVTAPTPSGSDNSTKLVTSEWVRAYAPSKTGEGASGKWNININGNAETSTKATQDKDGLPINTSYLKLSGGTLEGDLIANSHLIVSTIYNKSKTLSLYTTPKEADDTIGIFDYNSNMNKNIFWYRNSDKFFRFEVPVTAPTPSGSDNSTKLATTEWVKAQSASMSMPAKAMLTMALKDIEEPYIVDQYWVKDASGTINQFLEINLSGEEETDIPFPITFPQKCLFLTTEIINVEKDTNINCNFHIIEKTTDGAKLLKVGTGNPKKIIVKATGI